MDPPNFSFDNMETIHVDDDNNDEIQPRRDFIQEVDDHFVGSSESEKDEDDLIDDERVVLKT